MNTTGSPVRTRGTVRALFGVLAVLAVLGLIWLCMPLYREVRNVMTLSFPWVWEEKGRVAAPSGACELVIYEGNRGAMSSVAYVCFLVKPGGKADPNACDYYEPILSISHGLPKPRWEGHARLTISCDGGYVGYQRPYSREFNVAIEVRGGAMSRYEVSAYELATGVVRDVESPETRYIQGRGGEPSRFFDDEAEALRFKDELLGRFPGVEVAVRPEAITSGEVRFFREADGIVHEVITEQ